MNPPQVSVIIPTFNRAQLAIRAARSALAQRDVEVDVIVVDDGSTDGTASRLDEEYGSKVRVVRKENGGVASARNMGVDNARFDLVAFLDSDDVWSEDKLALQVRQICTGQGLDMSLTDLVHVSEDGKELAVSDRRKQLPFDGRIFEHVLLNPSLVPSSSLMRKSCFLALGGFDTTLRTAEDLDFFLRFSERYTVGLLSNPLVSCDRGRTDGLSELRQTTQDYVTAISRFLESRGSAIPSDLSNKAYFNMYMMNARSAASDKRLHESIAYFSKSFRYLRAWGQVRVQAKYLRQFIANLAVKMLHGLSGKSGA